jgi:acyl carrier protein
MQPGCAPARSSSPTRPRPTPRAACRPRKNALLHNLVRASCPQEGAEAFGRALALGLPQVIVSSLDLDALVRQADEAAAAANEAPAGQTFGRPDLDSAYVAPRNDIERTLAGFWQDLLGVGEVGVEDSFFDLGGHSLIAVRLFAMVRRAYRVDFPISVLFEAPTIAACAAMIAERIGHTATHRRRRQCRPGAAATSRAAPLHHLVAMHDGEGGRGRRSSWSRACSATCSTCAISRSFWAPTGRSTGCRRAGLFGDASPARST